MRTVLAPPWRTALMMSACVVGSDVADLGQIGVLEILGRREFTLRQALEVSQS